MAQEFSKAFYKSAAWKHCRDTYAKSKGGLCEDCMERGLITAGEEVHHVIELTPENIADPGVTLNWANLRLLCHDCHAKRHAKHKNRYKIDPKTGAVVI